MPAAQATPSFIDVEDIADVAALCIQDPAHSGKAYTLTGGEALSPGDIAEAIGHVTSRPVECVALSEDAARQEFSRFGLPTEDVERLLGFYRLVRAGATSVISPDVERLLGRAPRKLSDFVRRHSGTWNVPT